MPATSSATSAGCLSRSLPDGQPAAPTAPLSDVIPHLDPIDGLSERFERSRATLGTGHNSQKLTGPG
jgi:hypothetical protein